MVVKKDEDVDVHGNGVRRNQPNNYPLQPTPPQPLPPYYFILTAYHSHNTKHHNAYHASHNPLDNGLSDNALHYAHNDADKHGLNHAQAATALSPL